jgi:hypothetical protein
VGSMLAGDGVLEYKGDSAAALKSALSVESSAFHASPDGCCYNTSDRLQIICCKLFSI